MSPSTKNISEGCPTTLSSFLHPQCILNLIDYTGTGTGTTRKCDVCGDRADGLVYQCKGCEFDVHPLCTSIPRELNHALHPDHKLVYQSSVARPCAGCGSVCKGWRYGCEGCGFHIHPECVLEKSSDIPSNRARSPAAPPTPPPPLPYNAAYANGVLCGYPYNFYNYHFASNMQNPHAYAQPLCYNNYFHGYGNSPAQGGGVANGGANCVGKKMFQIVSQLALGVASNVIFGLLS